VQGVNEKVGGDPTFFRAATAAGKIVIGYQLFVIGLLVFDGGAPRESHFRSCKIF
jgi:hypothetical protein